MQPEVYAALCRINSAFAEVIEGLATLRHYPPFQRRELDRFSDLAKEVRSSCNSYLTNTIEAAEAEEAGRRYGKRRRQEKRDDEGA